MPKSKKDKTMRKKKGTVSGALQARRLADKLTKTGQLTDKQVSRALRKHGINLSKYTIQRRRATHGIPAAGVQKLSRSLEERTILRALELRQEEPDIEKILRRLKKEGHRITKNPLRQILSGKYFTKGLSADVTAALNRTRLRITIKRFKELGLGVKLERIEAVRKVISELEEKRSRMQNDKAREILVSERETHTF